MNEQLVSYKTAKLAKKKGFKEKCYARYNLYQELTLN